MASVTLRALGAAAVLLAAAGPREHAGRAAGDVEQPRLVQAQDPPPTIVTLTSKSTTRARATHLRLDGTAAVPDETVLKISVKPVLEGVTTTKFEPVLAEGIDLIPPVKSRKFNAEQPLGTPGTYRVTVEILNEMQTKRAIVDALRKANLPTRTFTFTFPLWSDEHMGQVSSKLDEITTRANEAHDLVSRIEKACDSAASWENQGKRLLKEADALASKMDGNPQLPTLFSASHDIVRETIRDIQKHGPYFVFVEGKWTKSKDYHEEDGAARTFRKESFHFGALKKYLEQVPWLAGRELVLWAIKDLRRTGGSFTSALTDALKDNAGRPGVSDLVERLQKATVDELDGLEKEARMVLEYKKEDKKGK